MTGQQVRSHFPLAFCWDSGNVLGVFSDSHSDISPLKSSRSTEGSFWQFLGRKTNDLENHQCFSSALAAPVNGQKWF